MRLLGLLFLAGVHLFVYIVYKLQQMGKQQQLQLLIKKEQMLQQGLTYPLKHLIVYLGILELEQDQLLLLI